MVDFTSLPRRISFTTQLHPAAVTDLGFQSFHEIARVVVQKKYSEQACFPHWSWIWFRSTNGCLIRAQWLQVDHFRHQSRKRLRNQEHRRKEAFEIESQATNTCN
jgi:hypothetical protein